MTIHDEVEQKVRELIRDTTESVWNAHHVVWIDGGRSVRIWQTQNYSPEEMARMLVDYYRSKITSNPSDVLKTLEKAIIQGYFQKAFVEGGEESNSLTLVLHNGKVFRIRSENVEECTPQDDTR